MSVFNDQSRDDFATVAVPLQAPLQPSQYGACVDNNGVGISFGAGRIRLVQSSFFVLSGAHGRIAQLHDLALLCPGCLSIGRRHRAKLCSFDSKRLWQTWITVDFDFAGSSVS